MNSKVFNQLNWENDDSNVPAINKMSEMDFWCDGKCDTIKNEEYDASYVDNGVSELCFKHHWRCDDCGKIVQVG